MYKKVIGIILIIIGGFSLFLALLYGFVFGVLGTGFRLISTAEDDFLNEPTTVTCTGEVIEVDDTTTIEYTVDGVTYQADFSMVHAIKYPVGTSITVYYNDTDPTECQVPELKEATFGTLGGVFSGVAVVCMILLLVFGAGFLVIGIVLIKSYKKQMANVQGEANQQ